MKPQKTGRLVFKLPSTLLANNKYKINISMREAMKVGTLVISISDSQLLTWVEHGRDIEDEVRSLKKRIAIAKRNNVTKAVIDEMYQNLYSLLFVSDLVVVHMDCDSHYDACNEGFMLNGRIYKRLICTVGGVKMSDVVYCAEDIRGGLLDKINNGRNQDKPIVPAKLNAYMALTMSSSVPVSMPKGIIVISDYVNHFKDNYINIDDSDTTREPVVTYMENQDIALNICDGCGVMLPQLAARWYNEIEHKDGMLSGCNLRWAFTKGMVYPFDFIEFAEKVAGTYIIKDVWDQDRDVREAELILTESQLKLCGAYPSYEAFYENCAKNEYTLRVAKTAPDFEELDNVRQLNYQFVGVLDIPDDDIDELIEPTVSEIKDMMGMDWRKSIVYMCGKGLNEDTVKYADPLCQAIMIEPSLIDDAFVHDRIKNMIAKRIQEAKIGVLDVEGNFQILSGDLYALMEHAFGLPVKGLLKAREVYSKFWSVRGTDKVFCARAPMSNAHSLLSLHVSTDERVLYWFRYIETCFILNAWDMSCMSLNGCD